MSEVINAKYITRETNHMEYQPGMEIVPGNIMEQVLEAREAMMKPNIPLPMSSAPCPRTC